MPPTDEKDRASYRAGARARLERERQELRARELRAWHLAQVAAALLRSRFGARRVAAFGSLIHSGMFTLRSDVDIAAWGLAPEDTFTAIGAVLDLDDEIPVNLADMEACSASLREHVERMAVDL